MSLDSKYVEGAVKRKRIPGRINRVCNGLKLGESIAHLRIQKNCLL